MEIRIGFSEKIKVDSLIEARSVWNKYINNMAENGLGASSVCGGDVFENGEIIAIFSYNGRCWEPDYKSEGNEYYRYFFSKKEILL